MSLLLILALFCLQTGATAGAEVTPQWECNSVLIRQQGPTWVMLDGSVTYSIKVQNVGGCSVAGASLTDYIPLRTVYKNATPVPASENGVAPIGPVDPNAPVVPIPVDKVEWGNLELSPDSPAQEFTVTVNVQSPGNRILTNTVCLEHSRTGRICDVLDVYVKP